MMVKVITAFPESFAGYPTSKLGDLLSLMAVLASSQLESPPCFLVNQIFMLISSFRSTRSVRATSSRTAN